MLLFLMFGFFEFNAQTITGIVLQPDSVTPMPFAYVISKKLNTGIMTDTEGKYSIKTSIDDTLSFSYIGYKKISIVVSKLDTNKSHKIIMLKQEFFLPQAVVFGQHIDKEERVMMERIINRPRPSAIGSPVSYLYDQYSRRGRELRKLEVIFEKMFLEEQVVRKFNPEVLERLTNNKNLDYEHFRKFCWVSDDYIATHEGYELYKSIYDCYKQYLKEFGKN